VLILKGDKVVCFDTLLQVLILKGFILRQNCAKWAASPFFGQVLIPNGFKLFRMNTPMPLVSVASKGLILH
jgi:hypothetical protein